MYKMASGKTVLSWDSTPEPHLCFIGPARVNANVRLLIDIRTKTRINIVTNIRHVF